MRNECTAANTARHDPEIGSVPWLLLRRLGEGTATAEELAVVFSTAGVAVERPPCGAIARAALIPFLRP